MTTTSSKSQGPVQDRKDDLRGKPTMGPEQRTSKGPRNVCGYLGVGEEDRVVIITDEKTLNIGNDLQKSAKEIGADVLLVRLEDFGERPMRELPSELQTKIEGFEPTVSMYAASIRDNEGPFRKQLIFDLFGKGGLNTRHAHMPGIDDGIIYGGSLETDPRQMQDLTERLASILEKSDKMIVTTPAGTILDVDLRKTDRWVRGDGRELKGQGSIDNLPTGETFCCPDLEEELLPRQGAVNGTIVIDGCLGDYFGEKYGSTKNFPLKIKIHNSSVVLIECEEKPELASELMGYVREIKNGRRIGEIGIGTNLGVTSEPKGNMLEDEKRPGVHVAIGDPLAEETGARWTVEPFVHVDMLMLNCSITVIDGKNERTEIMDKGRYLI